MLMLKKINYNTFNVNEYIISNPELKHQINNTDNTDNTDKSDNTDKTNKSDNTDNKKDYNISIITLVRNNKHYLIESMNSLVEQTVDKWNCIIINDGSNYNIKLSDFLSSEHEIKYKNKFKIINNKEWLGIVKCHTIGIFQATNEIIGILDCDDKLDITAIEKVLNIYNNSKDNIFVYSNFYYCDSKLNIINNGYGKHVKNLLNERKGNHFKTFKKKYYFFTSGYDHDLIFGAEDQDILFKIDEFCYPIFINECLYYYRTYDKNNKTMSLSCLEKCAKYSYNLSIIKNIYSRYNNLDFYVEVINKNNKYSVELKSNDIFITTINDNINYINQYINTKKNKFNVNIEWDYHALTFKISNKQFNLDTFRLLHPNNYFDNIYIINLKKDIHKKKRIESIFESYNMVCKFIEAVDGNIEPYYTEWHDTKLKTCGMYGYSKSMINIFEDAQKNNYNKILVCDDDIIFIKNFLVEFDKAIKSIPFSWKVLFFGLSGPWQFNESTFLYNFNFNKLYTTNLTLCDGSFCVGYDKSMYSSIINITKKYELSYDTQLIKYLNNNINIEKYAFYPHLVIADTTKASSIINYQEEMNIMQNFKRNHYKFHVNLNNYELNSMSINNYNNLKRQF